MKRGSLVLVGVAFLAIGSGFVAGDGEASWIALTTGGVLLLVAATEPRSR